VRTGIAASDAAFLPVGSVVNVTTGAAKHNGVYTIMDTGPKVQGRILDIYMWSCHDALAFGRQQIEVTVLRLGWNPENSVPSLVDRLFRRREATRATAPSTLRPAPDAAAALEEGTTTVGIAPTGVDAASPSAVASVSPDAESPSGAPQSEPPAYQIPPDAAAAAP